MMKTPKIRVWAILGEKNAGKTTVIGHLTHSIPISKAKNLPKEGKIRQVLLRGGGYLTVYATPRACQELEIEPDKFIDKVLKEAQTLAKQNPAISVSVFNVLVALRYKPASFNTYPAGHKYLSAFVDAGWDIESLALLQPDDASRAIYERFGAPIAYYKDLGDRKKNPQIHWMVGSVRNHFGWA